MNKKKESKVVPNVRFKGFTDDWKQRKLGEVGKCQSGIGFPDVEQGGKTGTPFYKVSDMNNYGNEQEMTCANNYVTDEQIVRKNWKPITEVPAVIFAKVGAAIMLNRKRLCRFPFLLDNNTMAYKFGEKWDTNFGKTLFEKIDLTELVQVGALPSYNATDVENLDIKMPIDINEQKVIGEFFANLDNLIILHQRKIDKLKNLKKAMLEKMFPKKGSVIPEIRFNGFANAWEQRKLGELAEIVGGGTPSTSVESYWDGDIDWYAPAEISEQIYLKSSQRKITEEGLNKSSAKVLPVGTVLFTSRAGIGKTAILLKEGCTNQGFQSIVPNKNKLDSYFIFTRSEELKRYGETVGAGSTFVEVSGKQMANMELMMPTTMDEQQKIGEYFSNLDNLITLHQRKLDMLKKLKSACLSEMFI